MDLEAPHVEVLAEKDQANTVFLLHGYGLAFTLIADHHSELGEWRWDLELLRPSLSSSVPAGGPGFITL